MRIVGEEERIEEGWGREKKWQTHEWKMKMYRSCVSDSE